MQSRPLTIGEALHTVDPTADQRWPEPLVQHLGADHYRLDLGSREAGRDGKSGRGRWPQPSGSMLRGAARNEAT